MRILSIMLLTLLLMPVVLGIVQFGNVSKSATHDATYVNIWTRLYNKSVTGYTITINYTNVPKILQGVKPHFAKPRELENDTVRNAGHVQLDPRTCPNDVAICYQVRERNVTAHNNTGANYSALSSYQLPSARIKTFVCVGDDLSCVKSATGCFCAQKEVPPPPILWQNSKCTDTTHLCRNSYGSFKLCEGNLSSCREQYNICGCGRKAACIATSNACINERNEIVLCGGALSDCLSKYKTCYCGTDMMTFEQGCTTQIHTCVKNNRTFVCYGNFNTCALKADTCSC